ncbi:hypothetical protein [Phytoactinopolyspora limicola]|uniref:hypothetical protein n=1 Tax=Phytoactinopolyspora limicola TaxID=2715536 RepID=UPI00140CADEE|nr:hypothetical protein [Phytoactinopolyspora limicola]
MIATALIVAGCSTTSSGSGNQDDGKTALESSLSRIQATEQTTRYVEFANTALYREVTGSGYSWTWGSLDGWGASVAGPYSGQLPSVLGVDLTEAEILVSIGESPHAVMLIGGGQKEDDVASSAADSGWNGDEVLATDGNPSQPLTSYVRQVRALDADAVLGEVEADLSVIDSERASLIDDPVIADLVDCLGDVVVAMVASRNYFPGTPPVAAGVRYDPDRPDEPVSVVCVQTVLAGDATVIAAAMEDALSTGQHPRSERPYTRYFDNPTVTVVDEGGTTVQMVARNTAEAYASTILHMTQAHTLPGFAESS